MPSIPRRRFLALSAGFAACGAPAYADDTRQIVLDAGGRTLTAREIGRPTDGDVLAVLSHGLGGTENSLVWLAESLTASRAFSVLPDHTASGRVALRGALWRAASGDDLQDALSETVADPALQRARSADIAAARAEGERLQRPRFRILIGHSMGAAATLIEAGAETRFGRIGHDAFDAYVAISVEGEGRLFPHGAWAKIRKPLLVVTGTRDAGPGGDYTWRTHAFDDAPAGRKRLAVIPGANHFQVGGARIGTVRPVVAALVAEFLQQARTGRLSPSVVQGARITDG